MKELLQKIEPYIKWYDQGTLKGLFEYSTEVQIYFNIPDTFALEDKKKAFYHFTVDENSEFQMSREIEDMYGIIAMIDAEFEKNFEYDFDFAPRRPLTSKEKEMVMHMMYYLLTDVAYCNLVSEDLSKKMSKELRFFLLDVLTDENPYLASVARDYNE